MLDSDFQICEQAEWRCSKCSSKKQQGRAKGLCRSCYLLSWQEKRSVVEPGWRSRYGKSAYKKRRPRLLAATAEKKRLKLLSRVSERKYCIVCKNLFHRRATEPTFRFIIRRHCSQRCARISNSLKGADVIRGTVFSSDHRAKIGAAHRGMKRSPKTALKISQSKKIAGITRRKAELERILAIGQRQCSKCCVIKTLAEFYFWNGKQRYDRICRSCKNLATAEWKRRYRRTPSGAIHMRVSAVVRRALGNRKGSKTTFSFLGYSLETLVSHIEKQFTSGMTWRQFCDGKIEIDHIVPVSSFDLTELSNVKLCWAITNLRPTWAKDNRIKGAKRIYLI